MKRGPIRPTEPLSSCFFGYEKRANEANRSAQSLIFILEGQKDHLILCKFDFTHYKKRAKEANWSSSGLILSSMKRGPRRPTDPLQA
jgi:hypothetical protein